MRTPLTAVLLTLVICAIARADHKFNFKYTFDDPASTPPIKSEPISHAEGAAVTCRRAGEWYPLLLGDGVQVKNIVEDSESVLSEGDRPVALERGKDYEIDYKGGRFKALDGGRVELGRPCSLSYRYSNPGPKVIDGALSLDGVDDFLTLPASPAGNRLKGLVFKTRLMLAAECSSDAVVLTKGDALVVRLKDGKLQAAGTLLKEPITQAVELSKNEWHPLGVFFDGKQLVFFVDNQEVGRQAPTLDELISSAPIRIGGTRDPEFLAGRVDDFILIGQ